MTEEEVKTTLFDGSTLLVCDACQKQFPHYGRGTPAKQCPTCKDIQQERPSVVQSRRLLNLYQAVQIVSLPTEWVEIPPQQHGDAVHYKQIVKGNQYGASWSGRIDIFSAEPFKVGDIVKVREMCSEHKLKIVRQERATMEHGTVTVEKELPVTSKEGEEVIRQRKYLVFERVQEGTQAQAKLLYVTAYTKTTLKGLGRQYWAEVQADATIAHWKISGGVRSGRAHTTGVMAIVSEEHPLYIKKTWDIEGEECYK